MIMIAVPVAILLLIVIIIIIVVASSGSEKVVDNSAELDRQARSKKLDLNMDNLIRLGDRPDSELYEASSYYGEFEYVLPESFLEKGNVQLVSYEAWYDAYNIEGMRFTFSNGEEDQVTDVFGLTEDRRGTPVETDQVSITDPVSSVSHLMVNTKLSVD